ncbi:phosphotransferase family protein [Streptomyces sp. NPDC020731]|uniref:phosphotransferase family protein n=1 Tax=Streptomyces sp. NPDC020731 TaxID=3365085 RepID=UPI00379737CF
MSAEKRTSLLEHELRAVTDDSRLEVRPWRSGVDFWADLAWQGDEIAGVVRSPRHETLDTTYEGVVDFGRIMAKETVVLGLMAERGVPVPAVLAWRERSHPDGVSWMLCEYVEHEPDAELTEELQWQLGQYAHHIHTIEPGAAELRLGVSWADYVVGRLGDRLDAAARYCAPLATPAVLRRAAEVAQGRSAHAVSLLHLDLRATNVCVHEGRIAAVIDVANAIVGDPLFELARIRSYGLLTESFCKGYGISADEVDRYGAALDVYEVDTAALLTTVAAEEIHDDELLATSRTRLEELCRRIALQDAAVR